MLSNLSQENILKNLIVNQYVSRKSSTSVTKTFIKLNNDTNIASNSSYTKSNNMNYMLVSRNFFVKFINQFWRETIFLSSTNSLADTYIEKLKVDGLSVYSKEYKMFLSDFSKALINGRISIAFNGSDFNLVKANNTIYLKYIWKKGLNFYWPQKNSYLFSLFNYMRASNKKQNFLMNELPLFTVVNNLNQVVLSESSNEILIHKNFIDYLYNVYSKYFLTNLFNKIKYQGLFFMNVKDAEEYKNYIESKYPSISEFKNLQVVVNQLNLYYKLVHSGFNHIDFRLVPDLTEVGNFIYKYQYYKNIRINKSQNYGSTFFQGQPIYFIEPILAINKSNNKMELVKYIYSSLSKENSLEYTAVFMNYKTAVLAWQKFSQQMIDYDLPIKPQLTVYNLESFIKQSETNKYSTSKKVLFVPSIESYSYLKNTAKIHIRFNLFNKVMNNFSSVKLLSQRILWSLTSRQPLNS